MTGLPPGAVCNPYQREIFAHVGTSLDMVTSAKTGAGKTQAMHIIAAPTVERGERIAVLGIMKALADQKKREFSEIWHPWRRLPQAVLSGDTSDDPGRQKMLEAAALIAATPEALLSKALKNTSKDNQWVNEIGFLGVDEAHLIGQEGRGPVMETLVHTMIKLNPDLQVMLMSGTLPNIEDFVDWLEKLKGRPPLVVESTYAPVEIDRFYVSTALPTTYTPKGSTDPTFDAVLHAIEENEGKQVMVAVWNKAQGKSLLNKLHEKGIEARFHNGDLDKDERQEIEALFMKRMLNVLICTSTLFTGMNMPVDVVVAASVYWHGGRDIPYSEIMQALGRAGRKGFSERGKQYVLIPHEEDSEEWNRHVDRLTKGEPVISMLSDPKQLASHFLGAVFNGMVDDMTSFLEWHDGTLWSVQAPKYRPNYDTEAHLTKAASDMVRAKMIRKDDYEKGKYVLTYQGKVAAQMMLDPYHFADLIYNFDRISQIENLTDNDLILAYACCSEYRNDYDNPIVRNRLLDEPLRLRTPAGCASAVAALSLHVSNSRMPDEWGLKALAYQMQMGVERWMSAIFRLRREAKMFVKLDVVDTANFFARVHNHFLSRTAASVQLDVFDASEIISLGTKGIFGLDMAKKFRNKAKGALSQRRLEELRVSTGGGRQSMADMFAPRSPKKTVSKASKAVTSFTSKLKRIKR